MSGQFSQLERKFIEPIAIAIEGGKIRAMQCFVSDAPWDDEKIMRKYRRLVNEDFGHPDGAIIFDESGFVKKRKGFHRRWTAILRHDRESGNFQVGITIF